MVMIFWPYDTLGQHLFLIREHTPGDRAVRERERSRDRKRVAEILEGVLAC